ncbi:D-methionine transport system ATP-binding protein [Roseateles sp. YR242]|uniref:methionine ABC transporter ATP-binding protein n=1 Tax=Roseateles sp. YR242 TaxID=1855305 RepID=UPI0008D7A9FF|nr:ATP-binding cassette domain-containing protein [Roseateles sp. YR242]SEK24391.1 D-methionine transport system ATP-binding protein [Roseateles sp. YR242]
MSASTTPTPAPTASGIPVIQLTGVSRTFRLPDGSAFSAVSQADLSVQAGEVLGIIGKSGAGKSTLLRLINLLERPDAGTVRVEGKDLTALSSQALRQARQGIGMIFQQFNLLQNATVADNVAFALKLHAGRRRADIERRVQECLALVGLQDKAKAYPAQLSGGQKQRVAIARALAPHPAVLLCDEPTSSLDAETTREVLATLADVNVRLGVTIVIVTHELSVVQALCHRVAVMHGGRLVETFNKADAGQGTSVLARELAALAPVAPLVPLQPSPPSVPEAASTPTPLEQEAAHV